MITKSNKHHWEMSNMKNHFLPTNSTSCLKIRIESAGNSFDNLGGTLDLPIHLHTLGTDRFLCLKYLYILFLCILFLPMSRSPTMFHFVRTMEESSKVRSKERCTELLKLIRLVHGFWNQFSWKDGFRVFKTKYESL